MSLAADTAFDGPKLPFRTFEFGDGEGSIRFNANKRGFTCDISAYACETGDTLVNRTPYVRSPDGRHEAFVHEHNLWMRPAEGGDSTQLTMDGEEYWAYGATAPRPSLIIASIPTRPVLQWSPRLEADRGPADGRAQRGADADLLVHHVAGPSSTRTRMASPATPSSPPSTST